MEVVVNMNVTVWVSLHCLGESVGVVDRNSLEVVVAIGNKEKVKTLSMN